MPQEEKSKGIPKIAIPSIVETQLTYLSLDLGGRSIFRFVPRRGPRLGLIDVCQQRANSHSSLQFAIWILDVHQSQLLTSLGIMKAR